jgi:MOSC domain-containing protein YiiM
MTMIELVSLQIGVPRTYHAFDERAGRMKEWRSAIDKQPVAGPIEVTATGLTGDVQANRKVHGGVDKALLAYSGDHYRRWKDIIDGFEGRPGSFGENLTFNGLAEPDVCIGDRWQLGEVVVEVSQPRQPCSNLSRRWSRPSLVIEVVANGWTGWYLRIITPGMLSAGDPVALLERPHPEWPIPRAHRAMYGLSDDPRDAGELAQLPVLSLAWREELLSK